MSSTIWVQQRLINYACKDYLTRPDFYKRFDLKIEIYITLLNLNQLKQLILFSKVLVKTYKSAGGTF